MNSFNYVRQPFENGINQPVGKHKMSIIFVARNEINKKQDFLLLTSHVSTEFKKRTLISAAFQDITNTPTRVRFKVNAALLSK